MGLKWLVNTLCFAIFESDRILSVAKNLLSDLRSNLRDGAVSCAELGNRVLGTQHSIEKKISRFNQNGFLKNIKKSIVHNKTDEIKNILSKLNKIRAYLLSNPNKMCVQLCVPNDFESREEKIDTFFNLLNQVNQH